MIIFPSPSESVEARQAHKLISSVKTGLFLFVFTLSRLSRDGFSNTDKCCFIHNRCRPFFIARDNRKKLFYLLCDSTTRETQTLAEVEWKIESKCGESRKITASEGRVINFDIVLECRFESINFNPYFFLFLFHLSCSLRTFLWP